MKQSATSTKPETEDDATERAVTRPCRDCGAATPWHQISVGDLDISQLLPCRCHTCADIHAQHIAAAEKESRITAGIESLRNVIEPRMRDTDITHPDFNSRAWAQIKLHNVGSSQNLLIVGQAGLCKSRFCALLLKRAALRGLSIAWLACDTLEDIGNEASKWKTRAEAQARIDKLKRADRLVIDDLGKHPMNEITESMLFRVLDHRYRHLLPTYVSANTHPSVLLGEDYFSRDRGAPIVGRILEGAAVYKLTHKPETLFDS